MNEEQIKDAIHYNYHRGYPMEDVQGIQKFLGVQATGDWNAATVKAVATWQEQNELEVDGKVGPLTMAKLEATWAPAVVVPVKSTALESVHHGDLPKLMQGVLDFAREDWDNGTSEADLSKQGRLAQIFRDSGWSKYGVDTQKDTGAPVDWCGMSVAAWLFRGGLDGEHRKTFYQTRNVESCFTYSKKGVSHRTMKKALIGNETILLEHLHEQKESVRLWTEHTAIRSKPLDELDIQPGDVALINHKGNTDHAHHITMVLDWKDGVLTTIEGNCSGLDPDGNKIKQSVAINHRDLKEQNHLRRIYGLGRLSVVDFADLDYR